MNDCGKRQTQISSNELADRKELLPVQETAINKIIERALLTLQIIVISLFLLFILGHTGLFNFYRDFS